MANVLFRRGTQEYINNNVPISDGQVVFNETDQAIYVDTPVNNVITRLRYGGGNLSRSDIDSALSDTSENPVQNKVITESVLQKTDIVNDYNTAVAVTATDIPVGCGVIKTANTKIGDLQSALNTTNGTVAQHTTDIEALNTGLANKIGTFTDSTRAQISDIVYNMTDGAFKARIASDGNWGFLTHPVKYYQGTWLTPVAQNLVIDSAALFGWDRLRTLCINFHFTQQTNLADGTQLFNVLSTAPVGSFFALARNGGSQMAQLALNGNKTINLWGAMQSVAAATWSVQFTYFTI